MKWLTFQCCNPPLFLLNDDLGAYKFLTFKKDPHNFTLCVDALVLRLLVLFPANRE